MSMQDMLELINVKPRTNNELTKLTKLAPSSVCRATHRLFVKQMVTREPNKEKARCIDGGLRGHEYVYTITRYGREMV